MKKLLLFAAVLFGLTACQNDPKEIGANLGSEQDVEILVSLSETSRADSGEGVFSNINLAEEDLTLRYIFQVWNEAGKLSQEKQYEYRTEPETVSFPVRLIPGRKYTFAVWADIVDAEEKVDLHYDTDDLREIKIKDWNAMDETRDAYTGFWSDTYTGSQNIEINLTRPFAKLRVITTDMNDLLGVVPTSAVVSYNTLNPCTTFNALVGKPGVRVEAKKTHSYNLVENGEYIHYEQVDNTLTLFADYLFAAESDIVNFTLTVNDQKDEEIITRTFNTAIPVKRNNLTTIEGNILTVGDEIKVNIHDEFTQPGTDINVYSGPMNKAIELESGHYIFESLSVNTTEENAVIIPEGANVTIDIVGNVSLKSAGKAIYIPASSTLTINGAVAETRSAQGSKLNIIGGNGVNSDANGSAIYVDGELFINNLASLTAKGYGKCGYGIGGINAKVTIENTTIDYVCGGYIQPLFVNDTKYGKSEPEGGAAIGGAKVVIKNSTITKAEGGSKAAAIGNRYWSSTNVTIEDSTLGDIRGGNASAAIGGSRYDGEAKHNISIAIKNSTIANAVGGQFGAGIGSGYDTHCNQQKYTATNNIVIEGSTITAQGGKYGAGIGTGFHSAYLTGSIDAASTINATAGDGFYKNTYTHAQNIGYGIVDPAREFSGANATPSFTVNNAVVATPELAYANGIIFKDGVYHICSAAGLEWFADEINAIAPYEASIYDDATFVLDNDINYGGKEWTPIGDWASQRTEFHGTFDGQGHTISNFVITKPCERGEKQADSSYGLFGNVKGGTVKNVTVSNVSISGVSKFAAALVGRLDGTIENCHVKNASIVCSSWQVGGLVAQYNGGNISGCSVEETTISSGVGAVGAIAGYALYNVERTIENCSAKNCTLIQTKPYGAGYDDMYAAILGGVNEAGTTININGCTAERNTIKGVMSDKIVGYIEPGAKVYIDDNLYACAETTEQLEAALKAGGNVALVNNITMTKALALSNANFTLDGNGYTITMAEDATNTYALFDITGGKAAIKNITFDGIKSGAIVRTVGVEFNAENVVAKNGAHTQQQGLFRLMGKSTIKNSTFKNNTCSMVITLNYDGANNDPQVVENCVFEGNTCNGTAVLYYVKGEKATINGNKFIGNTVNCTTNGATIYMGFTENNVVTNNLFQNNTVNEAKESSRVAGGVFFGYETVFTGNAFIGNKVTGINAKGNDVCVSTYYTSIDLSGNYWGGNTPVEDTNYFVQHKSDERVVTINSYLTANPFN